MSELWVCMPGNRFAIYFVLSHECGDDHAGLQMLKQHKSEQFVWRLNHTLGIK